MEERGKMFLLNRICLGQNEAQMQSRKQQGGAVEENLPSKRELAVNGKHQALSGLANQPVKKTAQKE